MTQASIELKDFAKNFDNLQLEPQQQVSHLGEYWKVAKQGQLGPSGAKQGQAGPKRAKEDQMEPNRAKRTKRG